MRYLIAVIASFTQQKVEMYILGEDADENEVKNEIESNLCAGVQVTYYEGYNDRLVEPDGYNFVGMVNND